MNLDIRSHIINNFKGDDINVLRDAIEESIKNNDEITLPIQFNGKLKATISISLDEDEASVKSKVHEAIDSKLDGKTIVKEIYVKNKIYNIVVK